MTIIIMIAQLILGLSILVVLHELGHYLFARLFKIRVEKFYLFFNPKFSLLRAKKVNGRWSVKFFSKNVPSNLREKRDADGFAIQDAKGRPVWEPIPLDEFAEDDWRKYPESTEWGVGWLPFGGYCAIAGMIDETKSADQMESTPQPWEFRTKPAWQRLLVMIGGVLMNFILGCALFIFITYHYEGGYLANKDVSEYGIYAYNEGEQLGFETGDKIVAINGKDVVRFKDVGKTGVFFGSDITVERDGKLVDVIIPDTAYRIIQQGGRLFSSSNFPVVVDSVVDDSPASRGGLKSGDRIIDVNDVAIPSFGALQEELQECVNSEIVVTVLRNNDTVALSMQVDSLPVLGFFQHYPYTPVHYTFGQAVKYGLSDATDLLSANIKGLGNIVKGQEKASESLSGPIGIATIYGGSWDWSRFWFITALLSLVLAFMNLLPIPALDGGHVVFLLYEMITGRKPSDKFMEYAQLVGMLLLFALMFFVIGNDIFKLFK